MTTKKEIGFPTTSLTLVEKLARGEDWKRFCNRYYEPIRRKFDAINWKKGHPIDKVNEADAISAIFLKLKAKLQASYHRRNNAFSSSYDPAKGRLRAWLSTFVRNAISDYRKDIEKDQEHLMRSCDASICGDDDALDDSKTMIESIPDRDQQLSDDREWMRFLQHSAIKFAETRRPWRARDKRIILVIKEELSKAKIDRRSDAEIADSFGITEVSLRQIRHRFMSEVRKQYDEFKTDDPLYFEALKDNGMTFDALVDEYLKMDGGEEGTAERREKFKRRNGIL